MTTLGSATTEIGAVYLADEVIVNRLGSTGRQSVDMFAQQIWARIGGPAYETLTELAADLLWDAGALGTVWGDTEENGIYRKDGATGAGDWVWIGDLPVGAVSAARISEAVEAEASDRRAGDLALIAALSAAGLVFADLASGMDATADGGTFVVAETDGDGVSIYQRVGGVAVFLTKIRPDAELAKAWATGTEPGGVGTKSAREYAADALQVAADVATVPSVTALGAIDSADPSGRAVYAPALVTSMQSYLRNGVTLRALLGGLYNPANDGAGTLSGFISELAPAGITITDPDRLTVLCEEPVRIESGMRLNLSGTYFSKGFSATSAAASGLFSRAIWGTATDDFDLRGFTVGPASPTQTGKLFALLGDRWRVSDVHIDGYYGGQAFVFGGNEFSMSNITGGTDSTTFGTGFMRCLGGRNGLIQNVRNARAGDDLFQFVPIGAAADPYYGADIDNIWYIGCTGVSHSARVMIAALESDESGTVTSTIKNSGWIACGGKSGNRALCILNTDGDQGARQIDNISAIGCHVDGSDDDGAATYLAEISANAAGGVGRVNIDKTRIEKNVKATGFYVGFSGHDGGVLSLRDSIVEGESSAISTGTSGNGEIVIDGGRLSVVDQGGGHGAGMVVADNGAARITAANVEITGIASTKAAFRANHSSARHYLRGVTAKKASGAVSTRMSSNIAGSLVYVEDPRGDYDELDTGGYVRLNPMPGSGNVVLRFSTAQTLSAAYIGKTNNMQSGSAITLTVPTNAVDPLPIGVVIPFVVLGTGSVTLAGSVTFKGATSFASNSWFTLEKVSTDTWMVRS